MAGRMADLEALLQGDLVGGDIDGDLVGDLLGDTDGDLVGDLLGAQQGRNVIMKLRHGPAHLTSADVAWLRSHLLNNAQARKALEALTARGTMNVRGAPPLINRIPGVPATTESRGFIGFNGGDGFKPFKSTLNQQTYIALPQRPVKLSRLVITSAFVPGTLVAPPTNGYQCIIRDFKVGQTSILAGAGGLPIEMFAPQVMNSAFNGVSAGPGVIISMDLELLGADNTNNTWSQIVTAGAYADQVI